MCLLLVLVIRLQPSASMLQLADRGLQRRAILFCLTQDLLLRGEVAQSVLEKPLHFCEMVQLPV